MKLSIITVVWNGADHIRDCLESVQRQTVGAEHLVVDGASTDGSIDIVKQVAAQPAASPGHRLTWHSEPDDGIYDGMNKGLARASGDVIGILNADDFYIHDRVLERVEALFGDPTVDAAYADLVYVDPDQTSQIRRRWRAGGYRPASFRWGWMPPHPTFFVRREVYAEHGAFRTDLGTSADYDLMLRLLLKHRIKAAYLPEAVTAMRMGGASNVSLAARRTANQMDRRAWETNGLKPYPWTLAMKPLRKLPQFLGRGQLGNS